MHLERKFPDQQLCSLLVASNLTKGNGARFPTAFFLDTTGRGRALAGSLGGELLARSLATSGLASSANN